MTPYLRSANVTWRGIDVSDVKEMNFDPAERDKYRLAPGDILLNEASGSPNEVGKPAIWRNEIAGACFQNTLLRVRPSELDVHYLFWFFYFSALTGRSGELARGVNIRHLGKRGLESFSLPISPVQEQRRIVAAIEEHFSRLDAAEADLKRAEHQNPKLVRALIDQAIDPLPAISRLGDSAELLSGRAFPSSEYADEGLLLLRPGNLHASGNVEWSDSASRRLPQQFGDLHPKYLLRGERLLMNLTAQSLADEFLGRVCLSAHDDEFLLNQRIADISGPCFLPKFLFYVFRSSRFRRFVDGQNTGSLIQHISTRQLVDFTLPAPSREQQATIVAELELALEQVATSKQIGRRSLVRVVSLRRSILAAAFSGQLVPQDHEDEPASVLLERIAAERAAAKPSRKKKASK